MLTSIDRYADAAAKFTPYCRSVRARVMGCDQSSHNLQTFQLARRNDCSFVLRGFQIIYMPLAPWSAQTLPYQSYFMFYEYLIRVSIKRRCVFVESLVPLPPRAPIARGPSERWHLSCYQEWNNRPHNDALSTQRFVAVCAATNLYKFRILSTHKDYTLINKNIKPGAFI